MATGGRPGVTPLYAPTTPESEVNAPWTQPNPTRQPRGRAKDGRGPRTGDDKEPRRKKKRRATGRTSDAPRRWSPPLLFQRKPEPHTDTENQRKTRERRAPDDKSERETQREEREQRKTQKDTGTKPREKQRENPKKPTQPYVNRA